MTQAILRYDIVTAGSNILCTIFFIVCSFARQVIATLGFDWLLLFLQPHVHMENVIRVLRMLVLLLLGDTTLKRKFLSGLNYYK